MSGFEHWLVANSSYMANVENVVRMLTLFAPGQNNDVELISEAAGSLLQVLGVYHSGIVARVLAEKKLPLSPHARYIRAQMAETKSYAAVAYTLSAVRCSELLIEMLARQRAGEKGRWKAVIGVESLKAILRLLLMAISQRPVAMPPVYEREMDPEAVEQLVLGFDNPDQAAAVAEKTTPGATAPPPIPQRLERSGKTLPPLEASLSVEFARETMAAKMLKTEDLRPPVQLLRKLQAKTLAGDLVSIFRPVIYALLAYKYRAHKRSWTPWLTGVLIEFLGRQLSAQGFTARGRNSVSSVELEQLKRKTSSLWSWALRDPFYSSFTRPTIVRFANKLNRVPLVSMFSVLVHDYLYLLDTYYFPSASI